MLDRFRRRVDEMYFVYRRLDRTRRVLAWLGFWGGIATSYFGVGLVVLLFTLYWLYRKSKGAGSASREVARSGGEGWKCDP